MNGNFDVISFGEILWDVIDGVSHIGGAPFNFAAHAARCGLKSGIVSAIGNDGLGRDALNAATGFGVDVSQVSVHPVLPTGTVNVTLQNGIPSYEIVQPVAWDEIALPERIHLTPRAFYFGTLSQRGPLSAATLSELLRKFESSIVFFDVNLRQDFWDAEIVGKGLANADILKVNDEEMNRLGFVPDDLLARFPRLKIIVETRGALGCRIVSRKGERFDSPAFTDEPVVDTVGAGDSFSAAFLASLLRGESLESAAEAGNRLAGRVAARAGAIPENL
jgi:fructokinase